MQTIYQTHGSTFKNTNYISQDPYRASPALTLDMGSTYSRFCPPERKVANARLAVLDNFKEISRIMTQNFLSHKKLEKRYEKTSIPKSEMDRKRQEEEAQDRMTSILKTMHSPANFAAPEVMLPGQDNTAVTSRNSIQKWDPSMQPYHTGKTSKNSSPARYRGENPKVYQDDEIY